MGCRMVISISLWLFQTNKNLLVLTFITMKCVFILSAHMKQFLSNPSNAIQKQILLCQNAKHKIDFYIVFIPLITKLRRQTNIFCLFILFFLDQLLQFSISHSIVYQYCHHV
jgi:hypothetical protein